MSIKYTFSVCWKYVLLGNFASCALLEKRPAALLVPDGIPNNAHGLPNEYGAIPVPYSRASDPNGPVSWEGATTTVMSVITPPPTAMFAPCQPINCTANASSVSIFYWPSETQNTACLATLTDLPDVTLPPDLTPVWPSIYAVVVSFTATDGCKQIGNAFDTFTASFAPDELSTISWAPGLTITNSFTDAPCGPPGYDLKGKPYQPWFVPPHAVFDQMGGPGYGGCDFFWWKDPMYTLVGDHGAINGPKLPTGSNLRRHERAEIEARAGIVMDVHSLDDSPTNAPKLPRHIGAAATAHVVPQAPAKTPDST